MNYESRFLEKYMLSLFLRDDSTVKKDERADLDLELINDCDYYHTNISVASIKSFVKSIPFESFFELRNVLVSFIVFTLYLLLNISRVQDVEQQ